MNKNKFENLWLICGPESSGSVFVAKTISYAVGHCETFGDYSGYGKNNITNCENLVWHQSIPSMRPKKFADDIEEQINSYKEKYKNINIIFTTRDKNISMASKMRRFGDNKSEAENDFRLSKDFFSKLASDPKVFIWNYEAMVLIGDAYFMRMYNHFGIQSSFVPIVKDGNKHYILSGIFFKLTHNLKSVIKRIILRLKNGSI